MTCAASARAGSWRRRSASRCISYAGGIQIGVVYLPGVGELALGWLSLPLTVFWFLLILNALNLIDGLDGLAAGITLFVALTLLIVWSSPSNLIVALALAALAGASLGFLRYNFHPASIFLGDSGSYFLGYNLAALSILGSLKSEAAVAILIPIIALGVPVIDALWSPVRRFILGQRIFTPDRDHIHHRLLKLGYTHRRAVLMLYAHHDADGRGRAVAGARPGRPRGAGADHGRQRRDLRHPLARLSAVHPPRAAWSAGSARSATSWGCGAAAAPFSNARP